MHIVSLLKGDRKWACLGREEEDLHLTLCGGGRSVSAAGVVLLPDLRYPAGSWGDGLVCPSLTIIGGMAAIEAITPDLHTEV